MDITEEIEKKDKDKKRKKNEFEELTIKNKQLEEEVLRAKADLINYRKRKDEEMQEFIKFANSELVLAILPIIDNFERALNIDEENLSSETKTFLTGFKLTYTSLKEILEAIGVKEIDCLGKKFDSRLENCLYTEANNELDDDIVSEIYTKGYMYLDKILRVAGVKVNKNELNEFIEKEKENL